MIDKKYEVAIVDTITTRYPIKVSCIQVLVCFFIMLTLLFSRYPQWKLSFRLRAMTGLKISTRAGLSFSCRSRIFEE